MANHVIGLVEAAMPVLSHQRICKYHPSRLEPEARPARERFVPRSFSAFWNNAVAVASLAVLLAVLVYLALRR
jgi:hypothetical protein